MHSHTVASLGTNVFPQLVRGNLVLLAARPGQGKTLLGLDLAIRAIQQGHGAAFFTLEFTREDVAECFKTLGEELGTYADRLLIDTSDDICADYIVTRLATARSNTLVVIDYPVTSNPGAASLSCDCR